MLGGGGGFPAPGGACSGYLVQHDRTKILIDPGYATFPQLTRHLPPEQVDAVFITHGHPDHCADLSPLLRARTLRDEPCPPLPIYALKGALDPVLALDGPKMLARAYTLHPIDPAKPARVGPFTVQALALPHFVPSVGFRVIAAEETLAYTGDTGPSPTLDILARRADLLVAEATYVREVPAEDAASLFSAQAAGELAQRAKARRLLLTHLWPGIDPDELEHAAREHFTGPVGIAEPGVTSELSRHLEGHQSF